MNTEIIKKMVAITAKALHMHQREDAATDQPAVSAAAPRHSGELKPNTGCRASESLLGSSTEGAAVEGSEAGHKPVSLAANEFLDSVFCAGHYCRESTRCARHQNRAGRPAALWIRGDLDSDRCDYFKSQAAA